MIGKHHRCCINHTLASFASIHTLSVCYIHTLGLLRFVTSPPTRAAERAADLLKQALAYTPSHRLLSFPCPVKEARSCGEWIIDVNHRPSCQQAVRFMKFQLPFRFRLYGRSRNRIGYSKPLWSEKGKAEESKPPTACTAAAKPKDCFHFLASICSSISVIELVLTF